MSRWILAALLVAASLLAPTARVGAATEASVAKPPALAAQGAVLMDAETGQILLERNARVRYYPASTTKILTALVAIERGGLDDRATISPTAWDVEGTTAFIEVGERLTLQQLLYGLMLPSGNDAAVAIAELIAGDVGKFAELMNEKARALGALDSHFVNPHGLHDPEHYTSARDLALIARYAMRNPVFRTIVATQEYTLPAARPGLQPRKFYNHNRLLGVYPGADGVKTGYTPEAAHTLVASATRDGRTLIAVALQTDQAGRWTDTARMLDFGFEAFVPEQLVAPGSEIGALPVVGGASESVAVVAAQPVSALVARPGTPKLPTTFGLADVERRVRLVDRIRAPVDAGMKVGEMDLLAHGRLIAKVDLRTGAAVSPAGLRGSLQGVARSAARAARPVGAALAAGWERVRLGPWLWGFGGLYAVWRTGVGIRRYRRKLRARRSAPGYIPLHRALQRDYGD